MAPGDDEPVVCQSFNTLTRRCTSAGLATSRRRPPTDGTGGWVRGSNAIRETSTAPFPALPCEAHQRTVRKDPGRRELRQQGTSTPQPSRSDSAAEHLPPSNPRSLCVISPLVCVMSLVGVRIRKMRGYLATSSAIRRRRDYCEVLTSPANDAALWQFAGDAGTTYACQR